LKEEEESVAKGDYKKLRQQESEVCGVVGTCRPFYIRKIEGGELKLN
jgi:hypothetical protein